MKKMLISLSFLASGASFAAKPPQGYFDERAGITAGHHATYLSLRSGWHLLEESPTMLDARTQNLKKNILFSGEPNYYSNTPVTLTKQNLSTPHVALEAIIGINFRKVPLLKRILALQSVERLYLGLGMSYYPRINTTGSFYSGILNYQNPVTSDPNLRSMNYQVSTSTEENFFSLIPETTFYYFAPRFGEGFLNTQFYAGLSAGLGFLSGKRKMTLKSQDLAAGANTYNIDASYQDTVIDGLGFRGGLHLGALLQLKYAHHIDIRAAYIYYETDATFMRTGYWNERERNSGTGQLGYTIARRNISEEHKYRFSQTGFLFTIGYTLRLL